MLLLTGHKSDQEIHYLAFLPDSCRVLSASRDGTIRLWNLSTGASEIVATSIPCPYGVSDVVLSPDGETVAWSDNKSFTLCRLTTGQQQTCGAIYGWNHLTISPDGRFLAGGRAPAIW